MCRVSTLLLTTGMHVASMQNARVFPCIIHTAYKLSIFRAFKSIQTITKTLNQYSDTVTNTSLPKASATFWTGDSTHSIHLAVTGSIVHGPSKWASYVHV